LAAAKPWNAKLALGVVSLLRKVKGDVDEEGDELVVVVLPLTPLFVVAVDDGETVAGDWV
jgi:hypothetical protein